MNEQDLYDLIFDTCAKIIDEQRDKSDCRYEHWRWMSGSNWTNPDFVQLVEDALLYYKIEEPKADRQWSAAKVVDELCYDWVAMDVAAFTLADRTLAVTLDRETAYEAEDLAHSRSEYLRAFDQARSQMARRGGREVGRDGGRRDYRDERGRDSRDSRPSRDTGRRLPPGRQDARSGRERVSSGLGAAQERRETAREPAPESRRQRAEAAPERPRPQPKPAVPSVEGPDFTAAKPYNRFALKGNVYIPTFLDRESLTFNPQAPFSYLYNVNTHVKFNVHHPDGTVTEELMPMSNDKDYLRHELVRSRPELDQTHSPTHRQAVGEGHPAPVDEAYTRKVQVELRRAVRDLESIPMISSISELNLFATYEKSIRPAEIPLVHAFKVIPLLLDASRLDETRAWFEDFVRSVNVTDACENMLRDRHRIDPVLIRYLDERLRVEVNFALRQRAGVGITLDSFLDEYPKLIQMLKQHRGEAWARDFSLRIKDLPRQVGSVLTPEAASTYIRQTLDIEPEQYQLNPPPVLALQQPYSCAVLGVHLSELGLELGEKAQAIDMERMPDLYRLVDDLLRKARTRIDNGVVYLVLADGTMVQVFEALMVPNTYLMRLM